MSNNIVSVNLSSSASTINNKTMKASKNILNPNLTEINMTEKTSLIGNNINLINNLELTEEEYSFEELMKSAEKTRQEDWQDYLDEKAKKEAEDKQKANEVMEAIKGIKQPIDLNSKQELTNLRDLYNGLTEDQKKLIPDSTLRQLEKAEEKIAKLEQYAAEEAAHQAYLEQRKQELEDLYKAREDNNGLFHPKIEAEIEKKILALEKELGVAHKPDGWESFCDTAKDVGATAVTFVGSAVEGFIDLGEGVVDGSIYGIAKTLQVFGVDDKWAEDIIAYDFSAEMYDKVVVDWIGVDEEIAYGTAHSVGNFVGEMVGYYALSSVPFVGTALCCVGGAGSAVEDSINTQLAETGEVNDWKVFGHSALGALEGFGFGKAAQGAKAGFKAIKSAGGITNTVKGVASSVSKESVKTTLKQSGKIAAKTVATTVTDADTYVETATVLADDVMNGIETGEWNVKGMLAETATVFGENYVSNLTAGMWKANSSITSDMAKTANKNYNDHSSDFTSKADYYADLAYVEKNNYWTTDIDGNDVHIVLDKNDSGITSCLTNDAKVKWATAVSECTDVNGMTRVNLAHTNSDVFTKFVLGEGSEYGTFGISGNYNFARLGDANPDGFMKNATASGNDLISQFKSESGIPIGAQKNDRIIFCSHDVDVNDVSMHTGKELNSYSERLPGGRLPNGDYEISYSTQRITSETAKGTAIIVKDGNGNDIWTGTLDELKDYQINNPDKYKSIVYG